MHRTDWSALRSGRLSRRALLQGTGVALSLPWLDAMQARAGQAPLESPHRMLVEVLDLCSKLGLKNLSVMSM